MSRQVTDFIFRFLGVKGHVASELYYSDHTADALMYAQERLAAHPDCLWVDVYKYSTLKRCYVRIMRYSKPRAKVVE